MIAEFRARTARLCRGYEIAPAKWALIAQHAAQDAHHLEFEPAPLWIGRREECNGGHCAPPIRPKRQSVIGRTVPSAVNDGSEDATTSINLTAQCSECQNTNTSGEQTDRKIFGTKTLDLAFLWRLGSEEREHEEVTYFSAG